ncbi:MAG: hypothetical protein LBP55_10475 [Candidatus Adiutrix sp.]|jgi:hypothetical protein|nr:hypothetical protein [Candidatus Adiutrix sp.]
MMTSQDIRELNIATSLLAGGLARGSETVLDVPLEVAQALAEARDQMASLPEVIENLNLSFERFATVSSAIHRMTELAGQAADDQTDDFDRQELNREFAALAQILASDAGRQYYPGPRLNLLSQGEAKSAALIISYLEPVIDNMGQELSEQKNLLGEVIIETINFLGIIAQCYPDSNGAGELSGLINEVRRQCNTIPVSTPAPVLH